jgi:hypothetical protein
MITWDEREEGCSHTNRLRRSCKEGRGRGSIERHEILELRAYQLPVAARMKHDAADTRLRMRGPTRALRCFRSLVLGGTGQKQSRLSASGLGAGAMVGQTASAPEAPQPITLVSTPNSRTTPAQGVCDGGHMSSMNLSFRISWC